MQVFGAFYFKSAIRDLWTLFFTLQVTCYLSIYEVAMPANAEIYVERFTNIIQFEFLNPEGIVRVWIEKWSFDDWLRGGKIEPLLSPDQEISMLVDLKMYLVIGVLLVLVAVVGGVFEKLGKGQVYSKMWRWFKEGGLIHCMNVTYINICMVVSIQYALFMNKSKYQTMAEKVIVWFIFSYLVLVPLYLFVFLWQDRHRLSADIKIRDVYFYLFKDIHTARNGGTIFYIPLSILRRALFVMIPAFFHGKSCNQI